MEKMSDRLNYDIENIEERLELVNKIIEENDEELVDYYTNIYNPHLNQSGLLSENTKIAKDLESLATYLIYSKENEVQSDEIITDYRKKRNNNREASIDIVIKATHRKETNKSIIKAPKIKVSKKDRVKFKELTETGKAINNLSRMISSGVDSSGNRLPLSEKKKLKWIRTDIQKDEIAIKNELKGYIRFQNITRSEKDHNQLSFIRYDDIKVIRALIEGYTDLKQISYDDCFGYLKHIIIDFEDLVEEADLSDILKDIFIFKVEGRSYDEILDFLKVKYDVVYTKPRLSKITREIIPNKIIEAYKQKKEDWIFTYIIKGKYKKCKRCNENYLSISKYFSPSHKGNSSLKNVCKNCRKNRKKKE
jgi:hypothetical protein